jgi:hypothetical protein
MISTSPSAIRHWIYYFGEKVNKRATNRRYFNKYEVINILAINYLIRVELYTLPGAKIKFKKWLDAEYHIPEEYLQIPGVTVQIESPSEEQPQES